MPHFLIRRTVLADRRLPLPGKVIVIGRSLDADVPIPHPSVSRRHALIEETDAGFVISDLGSSNGTFVDEVRVCPAEKAVLVLGCAFRVGEVRIVLAQDEVIGGGGGGALPAQVRPAARTDGPLTLSPSPKTPPVDASVARPASAEPPRAGKKPRPALKARIEERKAKRAVVRLAMMGVTIVLLALAAFFVYRIVDNRKRSTLRVPAEEPAGAGSAKQTEPQTKNPGVAPILVDEER